LHLDGVAEDLRDGPRELVAPDRRFAAGLVVRGGRNEALPRAEQIALEPRKHLAFGVALHVVLNSLQSFTTCSHSSAVIAPMWTCSVRPIRCVSHRYAEVRF